MDSLLGKTLLKLLVPLAAGIAVILISRKRRALWRGELGWQAPRLLPFLGWMVIWAVWIALSERLFTAMGMDRPTQWPSCPLSIVVLRIAAIGLAGPFCEEIVTRGLLFGRLRDTRLGPWTSIVLISLAWTALHYRYGLVTLLAVFCDGLLFGVARYRTASIWTPVAMHSMGNLFSIWQSLSG